MILKSRYYLFTLAMGLIGLGCVKKEFHEMTPKEKIQDCLGRSKVNYTPCPENLPSVKLVERKKTGQSCPEKMVEVKKSETFFACISKELCPNGVFQFEQVLYREGLMEFSCRDDTTAKVIAADLGTNRVAYIYRGKIKPGKAIIKHGELCEYQSKLLSEMVYYKEGNIFGPKISYDMDPKDPFKVKMRNVVCFAR